MTGLALEIDTFSLREAADVDPENGQSEIKTNGDSHLATSTSESTKLTIHKLSMRVLDEVFGEDQTQKQIFIDAERLKRAVQDAGQYAYGIAAVEVWMLNDETGQLVRPGRRPTLRAAGWWSNPHIPQTDALRRLDDPTHPSYDDPSPVMPGVCLPGVLFAQPSPSKRAELTRSTNIEEPTRTTTPSHRKSRSTRWQKTTASTAFNGPFDLSAVFDETKQEPNVHPLTQYGNISSCTIDAEVPRKPTPSHRKARSLHWHANEFSESCSNSPGDFSNGNIVKERDRVKKESSTTSIAKEEPSRADHALYFRDINSLLLDPDTAKTPRLTLLQDAGFTHATGIPFQSGGVEGIVMYYTIRTAANNSMATDMYAIDDDLFERGVTSVVNRVYLLCATELIGVVVASINARRAVTVMKLDLDPRPGAEPQDEPRKDDICDDEATKKKTPNALSTKTIKGIKVWWSKCHGGNLQIPPAMSRNQSLWTLGGSFVSLLMLSGISKSVHHLTNGKYFIMVGPLGALITLQYGLTSAPAAQPRNALLGQLVSGAIALPFTYIPTWILSPWVREAIAPAFSIFGMVKLGVVHPPAGATAVVLASGDYDWIFFALTIFVNVLLIFPAVVINNLSKKRQYPTYWGYYVEFFKRRKGDKVM